MTNTAVFLSYSVSGPQTKPIFVVTHSLLRATASPPASQGCFRDTAIRLNRLSCCWYTTPHGLYLAPCSPSSVGITPTESKVDQVGEETGEEPDDGCGAEQQSGGSRCCDDGEDHPHNCCNEESSSLQQLCWWSSPSSQQRDPPDCCSAPQPSSGSSPVSSPTWSTLLSVGVMPTDDGEHGARYNPGGVVYQQQERRFRRMAGPEAALRGTDQGGLPMVDPANQSAAPEHIPRFVRNVSVLGVGFILVEGLAVFVTSTAVAAARMTTTRSALAAWVPTGLGRPNVSLQVSEVGSDQQFCLLRAHATALV